MASKLKLTELLHPDSTVAAITINADNSVTIPTQSTTNLAYTGTLTGGTGVVNIGSGQIYKDASGNVGIGTTTTSSGRLSVVAGTGTTGNSLFLSNLDGTYNPFAQIQHNGINGVKFSNSSSFGGTAGNLTIEPASNLIFSPGQTERARIDSSGNLLVGTTSSPAFTSKLRVNGGIETHFTQFNMVGNSGATFEWVLRTGSTQSFYVNNASVVATLSTTGVWTNASDARYKENIVESGYGLSTVMALKPRAYNLIGQADKPQIGFIAQEVLDVLPEVVDSTYNSITEEDRYTLSYGQLTAVLTKAIQEQQALIQDLTTRLTTLEGN